MLFLLIIILGFVWQNFNSIFSTQTLSAKITDSKNNFDLFKNSFFKNFNLETLKIQLREEIIEMDRSLKELTSLDFKSLFNNIIEILDQISQKVSEIFNKILEKLNQGLRP